MCVYVCVRAVYIAMLPALIQSGLHYYALYIKTAEADTLHLPDKGVSLRTHI
jgi:hypothetical protein